MSLCPTIASQTLVVPAGAVAHSWPSVTATGVLEVPHQGALPLSKVPLSICSGPVASACAPVRTATPTAVATSVAASVEVTRARPDHLIGLLVMCLSEG